MPQPKCQDFFNMFSSIARDNNNEYKNDHTLQGEVEAVMEGSLRSHIVSNYSVNNYLNNSVTEEEIDTAIHSLKNYTAHGNDLIINEFLAYASRKKLHIFVKLCYIVLKTGIIPSDWCVGMIKPLFKNKGSPKDPSNYRVITMLW